VKIWLGLLLAPILVLADQSIAYALAGHECARQALLPHHVVHVAFLAAVAACTLLGGRMWRETRGATEGPVAERHFLAGLATGSGALSALVIAAMWFANTVLSPCFA
jgi:hypothetical protein